MGFQIEDRVYLKANPKEILTVRKIMTINGRAGYYVSLAEPDTWDFIPEQELELVFKPPEQPKPAFLPTSQAPGYAEPIRKEHTEVKHKGYTQGHVSLAHLLTDPQYSSQAKAILSALKSAYASVRLLPDPTRNDRRGKFVNEFRNLIRHSEALMVLKPFKPFAFKETDADDRETRVLRFPDVENTLLSTNFWSDAGVVKENGRLGSQIMKQIMEHIVEQVEDESDGLESGLAKMESILARAKISGAETSVLADQMETQSKKTCDELANL